MLRGIRTAGVLVAAVAAATTMSQGATATTPTVPDTRPSPAGSTSTTRIPSCFQRQKQPNEHQNLQRQTLSSSKTKSSFVPVESRLDQTPRGSSSAHKSARLAHIIMATSPRAHHAPLRSSSTRSYSSALSGRSSSSSALSSSNVEADGIASSSPAYRAVPIPRPDEPNLYSIPDGVHPGYRPLPWYAQFLTIVASALVSAATAARTWHPLLWMLRLSSKGISVVEFVMFAVKTVLLSLVSQAVLQEIFVPPSRLTMDDIFRQYFLPSKLSRYETVAVSPQSIPKIDTDEDSQQSDDATLGVHFLKCDGNSGKDAPLPRLGAVYVNHGFGASSLSWLPALPKLTKRMGCRVGLGHDAVGFGFTERPKQDVLFRVASSASIGMELLEKHGGMDPVMASQPESEEADGDNLGESFVIVPPEEKPKPAVAILGHSMGTLTTLDMALRMPEGTRQLVILVSPAIAAGVNEKKPKKKSLGPIRQNIKKVQSKFTTTFVYPVAGYVLRRLVGRKNFWRKGLELVWGDSDFLTDSDVLRFQWPSVGTGWERGLLRFATQSPLIVKGKLTDRELVRRVVERKDTTVYVIHGTADPVIKTKQVNKFFDQFPEIQRIEMEGLGHDPFEEDVDGFVDIVGSIVDEWHSSHK